MIFGFDSRELRILRRLNTPQKIQDFLNAIPINFEKHRETLLSPREVLKRNKAHCMEGALLAAAAFWVNGEPPLLLDLKTSKEDMEHVVTLFKRFGRWGAVSKTNHVVLRYRDPVYKSVRELAMSYFHEYFWWDTGRKSLRSFSKPFDLRKLGTGWLTSEKDLWHIAEKLDRSPHEKILTSQMLRFLRPADNIEKKANELTDWKRP